MEKLLQHFANLSTNKLGFEALGEEVFRFDYSQLDYKGLLPKQESDYARNILMHHLLEIVLLYWPLGVESAIHFHDGFWGYVAVLDGVCEEIEVIYIGYVKFSGQVFQEKDKGSLFVKARKRA